VTGQAELDFSGATYDPELDRERLGAQARKVWDVMEDGTWRTLDELQDATGIRSHASLSARLRDFRKEAFGRHTVTRRRRPGVDPEEGAFEYQLVPNTGGSNG